MSKNSNKSDNVALPIGQSWSIRLLALAHVVCPLLFFTNLTRNPYYTQIALLNIIIAVCGILWAVDVWRRNEWTFPVLPLNIPIAAFIVVALASTLHSWWAHPLLRPGLAYEGTRIWVFTLVNSFMAFYLPLFFTRALKSDPVELSIWTDIFCALIWGAMWLGFNEMRNTNPQATMWDAYGGFLWIAAIIYALTRVGRGRANEFFHLIFSVAILAGVYGIVQYMGRDLIWSSPVQPYGGRPVSTFGNPNFLSSYLLMVAPVALGFALASKKSQSWGYILVSLVCVASAVCTLTRSTMVGLLAAFGFMAIFLYRRENAPLVKKAFVAAGILILLVIVLPGSPVSKIQTPLHRFTEIFTVLKAHQSYGPWHQRILIWSSAWDMVTERPLLGKGWGEFELFYPFYQGRYLFDPLFIQWRTHANNAHNVLMEFWAQTGTLGTGVTLWMFIVLVVSGWCVIRKKSDGASRLAAAGLLAGSIGMVVDNFFGNVSIFFAVPAFLFWWNVGALFNEADVLSWVRRPLTNISRAVLLVFVVVCLSSGLYFVKRWNEEVHYFAGFKYAKTGYVMESIKELETAMQWFGGDVNNNYELGNSYARHAKDLFDKNLQEEGSRYVAKAIDSYRLALDANPGYDEIYYNTGVTQLQTQRVDDGVKNLETALLINPLLRNAYEQLAQIYVKRGNYTAAIKKYETGVVAFPLDKNLWNNLGVVYSHENRDQEAFNTYKKAFMIDFTFVQAYQNLQAAAVKLRVLEPLLEVPNLLEQLNTAMNTHSFERALVISEKLMTLLPDSQQMAVSRATVLFTADKVDEAVATLEEVAAKNPRYYEAHLYLGKIYQMQKKNDLARQHYLQALDIKGDSADAKTGLSQLQSTP